MFEDDIEIEACLKEAADFAAACLKTDNQGEKTALWKAATERLAPLVETHPAAAFDIGFLAEQLARYDWPGPAGTEESRRDTKSGLYKVALQHYVMLAEKPRGMFIGDDRLIRGMALTQLAQLCEDGVLGVPEWPYIFSLRQSAARDDYAPAQVLLADMHAEGRGTPVNKRAARHWLYKALGNADQLQPEILAYAGEKHTRISNELGLPDIRPGRPVTEISFSKPHTLG